MSKKRETLYNEKQKSKEVKSKTQEEVIVLSEKEEYRRNLILNGGMYKTILYISMPVAIYSLISIFFNFINSLIVANLGTEIFSMVAYIGSIQFMLSSLGGGLSVGGGILIAKYYGAGDFNKTKEYITNLNLFTFFICIVLILCTQPFAEIILIKSGADESIISSGAIYFRIEVMSMLWTFINQVYMSIEKARGNTKKIMYLNLLVIVTKITLSFLFTKVLGLGVISVAVATFLAHFSCTVIALESMLFNKNNPFRMKFKSAKVNFRIIKDIFIISFPIIFEKVAFSFGKVYVNTMATTYGPTAVGAADISNQLSGFITTVPSGFQSGETTVISQNLGSNNIKRAIEAFRVTLIINIIYSLISITLVYLYTDQIVSMYAQSDIEFAKEIKAIFQYELYCTFMANIAFTILGLLYGFGYTFITLIINVLRVFVFRIPVVYYFIHFTDVGIEALGYAMFISNTMMGVVSIIFAVFILKNIGKKYNINIKEVLGFRLGKVKI